ncbi:MAG TPA: DUF4357 domain-containing protein [Solirubrobacteraceae bacterium]
MTEPEIAELETHLDNFIPLFELVGVNVFQPAAPVTGLTNSLDISGGGTTDSDAPRLFLRTQLAEAEGEDRSRGFLVFEGAVGRAQKNVMQPGYEQLRDRLVQEGILVEDRDHVRLTKSYLFDSPSAAASVLSGGNKNGRTEWRDIGGVALREIQGRAATSVQPADEVNGLLVQVAPTDYEAEG